MTLDVQEAISVLYPRVSDPQLDPYPLYALLREQARVLQQVDEQGTWHLTGYQEVAAFLRDPRLSAHRTPSQLLNPPAQMTDQQRERVAFFLRYFRLLMLLQDPPEHTRLRALAAFAFTPRIVERLRSRIEQLVDELLAPHLLTGEMDVVTALAVPLPLIVIMEVLGIPTRDRTQFKAWSDALFAGGDPTSEQVFTARMELVMYLRDLIAERTAHPQEDLISAFVQARFEGTAFTEDEVIAQCEGILIAGHETTTALIANGLLALLSDEATWQHVRAHPDLTEAAIEELLRYDSPFQFATRTAREDILLDEHTIRTGERVILWLGAANRDPARFFNPDKLDLARQDNRHLAFGGGVHYCLGAALARLEGHIALSQLARLSGNVRLTAGRFVRSVGNPSLRTVLSLPITFLPDQV
jgi:cytochrome P450